MEILQPGKKNDDDVKHGRLEAEAEIYNPNRKDPSASERWKSMDRRQKLHHFREYYLKYVILGIVVLAFAGYMIYYIVKPDEKDTFFGASFNVYFDIDLEKDIPDRFGKYLESTTDTKPDKDRIFFKSYYDSVLTDTEVNNFFDKRRYDIFITTESRFKTYAKTDNYLDLKDVLPADKYEAYKDKLVFCNNQKQKDTTTEHAYGISLKDCNYKFYDYYENPINDAVIGIVINTQRPETAIDFIDFLFND